jgi:ubiquinone/menaquinone biosynthesis C-methylase UbiE
MGGAKVADVGGGYGVLTILMAKAYTLIQRSWDLIITDSQLKRLGRGDRKTFKRYY